MTRPDLLLVGCLAFSIVLRLGAFALTTIEVATGQVVEATPIAVFFGLYDSLPVSLGTVVLTYALIYYLRRNDYYTLLLIVPVSIFVFDFAHDLRFAVDPGLVS